MTTAVQILPGRLMSFAYISYRKRLTKRQREINQERAIAVSMHESFHIKHPISPCFGLLIWKPESCTLNYSQNLQKRGVFIASFNVFIFFYKSHVWVGRISWVLRVSKSLIVKISFELLFFYSKFNNLRHGSCRFLFFVDIRLVGGMM